MEAKLIKTKVGYHLWLNPETKEQEHIASDYEIVSDNGADLRKYKLSLKNCQAIERGYDLDELAEKACPDVISSAHSAFKAGFQKALEILGDKKFSEFLDKEKELGISDIKTIERIQWYYNTYFDKSQQTEWDVTFNPEELDVDGCLILNN